MATSYPTYSVTFACYNAVSYTKKCIESMEKYGPSLDRLVIVDNGSHDNTREYIQGLNLGGCVLNKANFGCGVAWNQGALVQQAEWTIIMNNDVLVSEKWIESLIGVAIAKGYEIISPSLIEGVHDYDFDTYSKEISHTMKDVIRDGYAHAVCLAVHQNVWNKIGYFQPKPSLWGYEDTLFFHDAKKANIKMATTGASWLHHFGSITQSEMKKEQGLTGKQGLSGRYNYRLLNQSWIERKLNKFKKTKDFQQFQKSELKSFGRTLHGIREDGNFIWK